VLRDLGQPQQARPLLERALTITEAVHGPDHPDVAIRLNNLATVLQDLGQPQQARPLAERALAIGESAWGPQHPSTQALHANLQSLDGQAGPLPAGQGEE
jgi:tetratricopeptide (TPR) repeat protein